MNRNSVVIMTLMAALVGAPVSADAGILKSLWKAGRDMAGKVLGEGAEASGKAVTKQATKHTDDVARVAMKNSDEAARLVAKNFGDELADVAKNVSPENSRRLLAIADDLKASGRGAEVLQLLKEGGKADQVVAFLHRNKATIAGGAAITALLTNPEAVLGAASDVTVGLADVAGNTIARPMIAAAGQQLDDSLTGEVVITVLLCVLGVMVLRLVVQSRRTGKNIKRYQQKEAAIAAEIAASKKASDAKKVFPRIWRA